MARALLQVSCASLKIITVLSYMTLLFLAKTVPLFLIIFINQLNKAGVFETVAEAVPCHAQLQDPGPVWGSTGIGSHFVSAINEMQVSKAETYGGSVQESAAFQNSFLAKALF